MDKSSSNDAFPPGGYQYHNQQGQQAGSGSGVNKFIAIPLEKVRLLKPWGDFFNPQAFSQPVGSLVQGRLGNNLRFFEANYYAVVLAIFIFSLLINIPLLLVSLVITGMFMSINAFSSNGQDVLLGQFTFPLNYALAAWLILSVILLGMVSAFGTFFWVLGLAACLIAIHALFYDDNRTSATSATLQEMEAGDS